MVNGFGPGGRAASRGSVGRTRGHSVKRQVWRSVKRRAKGACSKQAQRRRQLSNVKGTAHGAISLTKAPEASRRLKGYQRAMEPLPVSALRLGTQSQECSTARVTARLAQGRGLSRLQTKNRHRLELSWGTGEGDCTCSGPACKKRSKRRGCSPSLDPSSCCPTKDFFQQTWKEPPNRTPAYKTMHYRHTK